MEIKDLIGTCFVHMSDPYFYYLITDIRGTNIVIEWIDRDGKKDGAVNCEVETALKYFNAYIWIVVEKPIEYYFYVCRLHGDYADYTTNTIYKVNPRGSITTAKKYAPHISISSRNCYIYYKTDKFLPISELCVNEMQEKGITCNY